jgi:hypothetical protein
MSLDAYAITAGSTGRFLLVEARDADEPRRPKTGLAVGATPPATAAYVRDTEGRAVAFDLIPATAAEHRAGAWQEVDAALAPGVYRLAVPDEMLARGATRAVVVLQFPGATIDPVDIDLVAYDPLDPVRLGMGAISPEARIEALRGAFPRVTARELLEEQAKAGD